MNQTKAFTWIETMAAIAVMGILAFFAWTALKKQLIRGCGLSQELSNMKTLHLATLSMAMDGTTMKDSTLNWPGDTGGSFSNWAARIVPAYLGTNDFCKLLSMPGRLTPPGKVPTENNNGILVYQVREEHGGNYVFLTSANFTNTPSGGLALLAGSKPYGDKGFVVFRKGGDGAILLKKQVGNTSLIGAFAPLCK